MHYSLNEKARIVKDSVSCLELLERSGYSVDRSGFCLCPIHREKTPSLKVYREAKRGWYCYGCHKGGDVIDLASAIYGIEKGKAIDQVGRDFGLNISDDVDVHQQERIRAKMALQRKERDEREKKIKAAEDEYLDAFDEWKRNKEILETADPDSDEFYQAAMAKAEIKGRVEDAEKERMKWNR